MRGAGRLRMCTCAFEEPLEVDGPGGSVDIDWTPRFTRKGDLVLPPAKAEREAIAHGAVEAPVGGTLTVRADEETRSVSEGWRLSAKSRVWNVRRVRPEERGWITMGIEAGVPT